MSSTNDKLLQIAIQKKLICKFYGRRMHAVIGIPIQLDLEHLRLYIKTETNIVTILLGDVSAYEFPMETIDDGVLKIPSMPKQAPLKKEIRNDHSCFNCNKKIPLNMNFCSETCAKEYGEKKKKV